MIPHPMPYQGSKRNLARRILSFFPKGAKRLIEPFCGSAAVSIAALYYGKVKAVVLGDINAPLVELWRLIITRPNDVATGYRRLWEAQRGNERKFYDTVRTEFNENHDPVRFLYLLARCVKASVRYNTNGEFNQSPDNRRKGMNPRTMAMNILGASLLLKGKADARCADYKELLKEAGCGDIVYLDPPYQGVSSNRDRRYVQSVQFDEFCAELDKLNRRGVPFIVSYDGRTGDKRHGQKLPDELRLLHYEVDAGKSTQATLLGRDLTTYESLYVSRALVEKHGGSMAASRIHRRQLQLWEAGAR